MAISRSQQPRQNYGLGSFVKKAFNKVTKPFTKVAKKVMPKELAGIARMAAPFAAASNIPYAALIGGGLSALGQARQRGRINPFETFLAAAPGLRFAGGEGLGQFKITGVGGETGVGRNTLRDLFLRGEQLAPGFSSSEASQIRNANVYGEKPIFGEYGTKADEFLFGTPGEDLRFGEERMIPGTGETEVARFAATKPTKGLLGLGGEFDLLKNKAVDLAIRKKDGTTLSPLKIGSWGLGIYSGIEAKKYKDEMEAADAAEAALKAADSAATEADIAEAREWAETVFGRLSRADIGLAQGGRVNHAMGTGPVLPPDPTQPVNPFAPKPTGPVLPNKEMAMSYGYNDAMSDTYDLFLQMKKNKEIPIDMDFDIFLLEVVPEMSKKQTREDRPMAANGGLMRSNYALGTKPEPKESGLGGLPIEADMRYSGGFMPYGKKEKADDVPARLSKNEFVFTADAVRAAGGGSMNEGARRMYQTMKTLEQQNRMMS